MGTAFGRLSYFVLRFFIACVPDRTLSGLPSPHPEAPCPFSVSPTFVAHSCESSHLAKQENLRYYEDTKKE